MLLFLHNLFLFLSTTAFFTLFRFIRFLTLLCFLFLFHWWWRCWHRWWWRWRRSFWSFLIFNFFDSFNYDFFFLPICLFFQHRFLHCSCFIFWSFFFSWTFIWIFSCLFSILTSLFFLHFCEHCLHWNWF